MRADDRGTIITRAQDALQLGELAPWLREALAREYERMRVRTPDLRWAEHIEALLAASLAELARERQRAAAAKIRRTTQ